MDKNIAARPASVAQTISLLMEISRLDTLHRDLYFRRAHELMAPMLSQSAYAQMKEGLSSIEWLEKQLRAAIERGDWSRSLELTARIRGIQGSAAASSEWMKYAEALYDATAHIPIDPFSPGLHVFASGPAQGLQEWQDRAIEILSTLKRTDDSKKDFYARRESDFEALSIKAPAGKPEEKPTTASPTQLQRQALEALDAGNLSGLDQVITKLMEKPVEQEAKQVSEGAGPAEAAEFGNDLLWSFSDATLAGASRLGLVPARIESRRHLAYLIPQGWQPSFLRDEVKLNAKKQVERLTYPSGTSDREKEAIEFFLLDPFITSGGTRYQGCFVTEDLLIEDFPEPELNEKMPRAGLLSALGLESRWGLTRIEIEYALLRHGPRILEEELSLDPEAFRLVAIPPDTYIYLAPGRGWGQKQIWTHFDGYRVREDGNLQALAGGDQRFGGAYDVVGFSRAYTNEKVLARFVVVQKKRMMSWHRK
jgi:hypothetical protein